ncbi:MAG: glycosyltransferase, partial [Myxococcota bacterium]|nr:glycosyltransferase [Myxococcota bacterium]
MLSVCMIIRNEEKELVSFLKNVAPYADEIVAVDTGSTDRSRRILSKHPKVRLLRFPWVDDFAAARNISLEAAKGDWILVMDADERMENPKLLPELLAAEEIDAYNVCIRNLQPEGSLTRYEQSYLPRLFRNKGYRYEGIIHEQI